jgi:aspartate aminotransferase-like enzyme
MHTKLFIPGPTEVLADVREQMARPPHGHRSAEATALGERVVGKLQELLGTRGPIFLSTSSSSGLMEACVRNASRERILAVTCGAFGERWQRMAVDNGKAVDALSFEWGKAVRPERIAEALRSGRYDAVLATHNETSTGVMNSLVEIAQAVREFEDVLLFVDATSSLGAVAIDFTRLGLDGLLAGVQKGLAVPPGFAIMAASERAVERARGVENRFTSILCDTTTRIENARRSRLRHWRTCTLWTCSSSGFSPRRCPRGRAATVKWRPSFATGRAPASRSSPSRGANRSR